MLARKQEINLQLNQLADAALLGVVFWVCHQLRFYEIFSFDVSPEIPPFEYFLWVLAILIPFGPFLLELQGYYLYPLEKTALKSLGQILRAGMWLIVLVAISAFLFKLTIPSRSVPLLFCLIAPVVLLIKERIAISIHKHKLSKGALAERIILAGEVQKLAEIEAGFSPSQKLEIEVVARIDLEKEPVEVLVQALHEHAVGRVVLAFSKIEMLTVQHAIEACELEGVEAWLCADFVRTSVARPTYEVLARKPMLVFRTTPEISWTLIVKSAFDRVMAAVGLIVLSPLFLITAVAIRITSPGPIIFRQQRAGRHGRPFTMYKFRSMRSDAEMQRAELEIFNEMTGPVFKIDNDPRVTPVGNWIRRTSIDELPQLVNVLRGEMSVVGPRPLPIYEVEQFEKMSHRRRLSMKPGLTCLWQIRGRNRVTNFDEWVAMDLEYIDNWSLLLDGWILLRTVPVVLFGAGAK